MPTTGKPLEGGSEGEAVLAEPDLVRGVCDTRLALFFMGARHASRPADRSSGQA